MSAKRAIRMSRKYHCYCHCFGFIRLWIRNLPCARRIR